MYQKESAWKLPVGVCVPRVCYYACFLSTQLPLCFIVGVEISCKSDVGSRGRAAGDENDEPNQMDYSVFPEDTAP